MLMLSCREATRLMSEQLDRELPVGERAKLSVHLAICSGCRNFRRQMDFLRQACTRLGKGPEGMAGDEPADLRDKP